MANTSPVYARIDSDLKKKAEAILKQLGITPTSAIMMLYSQIVLKNSLPFKPTLVKRPKCLEEMTHEELEQEVLEGIKSIEEGRGHSKEEVRQLLLGDPGNDR